MLMPITLMAHDMVIGLSFEMEYSAARDTLLSRGFICKAPGSMVFLDKAGDSRVELAFTGQKPRLKCVSITIKGKDADELEDTALQMLSGFHGDDFDYDQEMREAWWKLDEFHFLNAAVGEDESSYVIFYGDIREEELNPY